MRISWPGAAVGALILAVGTAGLIRGALPQATATASGDTGANPIVVADAFVRPPVPPTQLAAAYFTVYNTTSRDDTLLSVATGAGRTAELHKEVNGVMTAISGGIVVPAHGSLVLSVGKGHVMIGDLFGPLKAGQIVNIELTFANAGPVEVAAPVKPFGSGG
jgi:copper(I)-binding protein